eukprot:scaffold1340_cov253-Pinguiococcus_pyrenoidosus.AAC.6
MRLFISHIGSYQGRSQAAEAKLQGWDVAPSYGDTIEDVLGADICVLNLQEDLQDLLELVDGIRLAHLAGLSRLKAVIGVSSLLSWGGSTEACADEQLYRRRYPMEGYEKLKMLEDRILALNGARLPLPSGATAEQRQAAENEQRLAGMIMATGMLFGEGEDALAPLFQVRHCSSCHSATAASLS